MPRRMAFPSPLRRDRLSLPCTARLKKAVLLPPIFPTASVPVFHGPRFVPGFRTSGSIINRLLRRYG
ncbi:hypothetical protein HMPREF1326_00428 [Akkermansia sp. KLE1605]|nr:hypothetical protein HMPREF1326_00428 [Akkermansia sp. KLE1605]